MLQRPPMPEDHQPRDIPEMLIKIQEVLDGVMKDAAGYFTLSEVYSQAVNGASDERKRGVPIMRYGGSLDGVSAMTLECDLNKVPSQYLPHVLSPMCNVHAHEMLTGLTRIQQYVNSVLADLQAAMAPAAPAASKPAKARKPKVSAPLPEAFEFDEGPEVTE